MDGTMNPAQPVHAPSKKGRDKFSAPAARIPRKKPHTGMNVLTADKPPPDY